jgi:hypothetical protein
MRKVALSGYRAKRGVEHPGNPWTAASEGCQRDGMVWEQALERFKLGTVVDLLESLGA